MALVPLPGTVVVSRCLRLAVDVGKCSVCGLVKASLVLARVVDPVTAQQVVGIITGMGGW